MDFRRLRLSHGSHRGLQQTMPYIAKSAYIRSSVGGFEYVFKKKYKMAAAANMNCYLATLDHPRSLLHGLACVLKFHIQNFCIKNAYIRKFNWWDLNTLSWLFLSLLDRWTPQRHWICSCQPLAILRGYSGAMERPMLATQQRWRRVQKHYTGYLDLACVPRPLCFHGLLLRIEAKSVFYCQINAKFLTVTLEVLYSEISLVILNMWIYK